MMTGLAFVCNRELLQAQVEAAAATATEITSKTQEAPICQGGLVKR